MRIHMRETPLDSSWFLYNMEDGSEKSHELISSSFIFLKGKKVKLISSVCS